MTLLDVIQLAVGIFLEAQNSIIHISGMDGWKAGLIWDCPPEHLYMALLAYSQDSQTSYMALDSQKNYFMREFPDCVAA